MQRLGLICVVRMLTRHCAVQCFLLSRLRVFLHETAEPSHVDAGSGGEALGKGTKGKSGGAYFFGSTS